MTPQAVRSLVHSKWLMLALFLVPWAEVSGFVKPCPPFVQEPFETCARVAVAKLIVFAFALRELLREELE